MGSMTMIAKIRLSMIAVLVLALAGSACSLYVLATVPGHGSGLWVSFAVVVAGAASSVLIIIYSPPRITGRVLDITKALGDTAATMLAVASQVSAGAVETATSVSEAMTTVEEVRVTSQLAREKANAVVDSAREAEQGAHDGVRSVVIAIDEFKASAGQMATTAECIVRLSEHTAAVSEIISTSSDIAERSNLLSVNAAIEAAKSIDGGKGFAVVAEEIKSLAQQSKQALVKVRGILTDIQKATSAAVFAAEQSSKMVETNTSDAEEHQREIEQLGESVANASRFAVQIAASAQQQFAGVDQICEAMASIDQASTQNAAGAKQIEAEATRLQELADQLRGMVQADFARVALRSAPDAAAEHVM